MFKRTHLFAVLLVGLLLGPIINWSGQAEMPGGPYRVSVPVSLVLVDPSGHYEEEVAGIRIEYDLICDGKGKISGTGDANASMYGVDINLRFGFTGSVSGGGGKVTRLTLSMKGTGQAVYEGTVYPVTFSASEKGEFNRASETFYGSAKVKVCVKAKGGGCESETSEFSFDAPGNNPGDWDCHVGLATDARNKVSGTGTVTVYGERPRTFNFAVTGKYTAKRDSSTVTLKATDGSGAKVSATGSCAGSMLQPSKLSGKILGQTVRM